MTTDKPHFTIIAALGPNRELGSQGDLSYHISADLKRFKRLTTGHPVIMGRKTFESFPNGALPGRRNIVITRNVDYAAPGVETAPSLESALEMTAGGPEAFIIGGGEIYRQALPLATSMELTLVETPPAHAADTWFPAYEDDWATVAQEGPETDPRTGAVYRFVTLRRVGDLKINA